MSFIKTKLIELKDIPKANQINPFQGLLKMEVTDEIVKNIADAKFAWRELIPQGHFIIFVAKANGGKTTFMIHVSGEIVKSGYEVIYINADAGASDIKEYQSHARENGYKLINPDLTNGTSELVIEELKKLSISEYDFSKYVIVLDTLKKFCDLMQKSSAKQFYTLLRTLTAKGMTVICLAHANKYEDKDGLPIYEGTGDTRNDCDDLIYLIPINNEDGSKTVSTLTDKARAPIKDITFVITKDRKIEIQNEYFNTLSVNKFKKDEENDLDVIEFILENISSISKSATELHKISKDTEAGYSRKRLNSVLTRYASPLSLEPKWLATKAPTNGIKYGMISPDYAEKLKNTPPHQNVMKV